MCKGRGGSEKEREREGGRDGQTRPSSSSASTSSRRRPAMMLMGMPAQMAHHPMPTSEKESEERTPIKPDFEAQDEALLRDAVKNSKAPQMTERSASTATRTMARATMIPLLYSFSHASFCSLVLAASSPSSPCTLR